jgi:hypothetical protein
MGQRRYRISPAVAARAIFVATMVALAPLWLVSDARAQCAPAAGAGTPPPGTTVTCSGTTVNQNAPNGYGDVSQTGIAVNVQQGASVTGTNAGIFLGTNNSVTNLGTVTGTATYGIFINGTGSVTNSGSASGGVYGIFVNGDGSVTNSGSATGTSTYGIFVNGNGSVTNSGSASGGVYGIFVNGNGSVTNSGSATGTSTYGIFVNGNGSVTNSGSASGGVNGIFVNGNGSVTNTGSVSGTSIYGIFINGSGSVANSGTVSGNTGIFVAGPANISNAGTIIGTGGTAIQLTGAPDTLTLLQGSRIIGAINLGGGGDTVNVRAGNQNLTFDTLAGATVTGTVPFVVSGNRIASIDPTPFGLTDKNLMDFTRAVSSILGSLDDRTLVSSGPAPTAFAPETGANRIGDAFASIPGLAYAANDNMVFKNPTMVYGDGRSVWARGFFGERYQQPDDTSVRARTQFEGGAIGFDLLARPDLRLGVFAGGGRSQMWLDFNFGSVNTDTVFGGVYGRYLFSSFGAPSFVDFALHGGGSSNASTRSNINNNLAPGGLEAATASYNSSYVSPELTYGVRLPLSANDTLTPSIRLRYVAGWFDGYTESGSTANLTVGSRTIQDFEQRGELKFTHTTTVSPREVLLTSVNVGVLGIERLGNTTINTVLLGQGLPFVTPGKNTVAGAFGGLGMEWRTRSGVSFFGAAEYITMTDQSSVVVGRGGIKVAF